MYALPGALDAVLALDRPGMLDHGYLRPPAATTGTGMPHELAGGSSLRIGPFHAQTRLLPHSLPNLGIRLAAEGRVLAYTGDSGQSPEVVALAGPRRIAVHSSCGRRGPADAGPRSFCRAERQRRQRAEGNDRRT